MYGCGLRIGEALAVRTRSRINRGTTLRVREQVNPVAEVKPLKFRVEGQFRDIPLPLYVSEAIDKHIVRHGTTDDGYLFRGRRHKHVTRRTYNEDFERAVAKAGLPPEFIPHTLRHCFASISLAHGIPITEVSRWLGHYDWDDDWVFDDPRFQLADGPDQVLLDFLAYMAHPVDRPDTDSLLTPDGWELRTTRFISGRPVYTVRTVSG